MAAEEGIRAAFRELGVAALWDAIKAGASTATREGIAQQGQVVIAHVAKNLEVLRCELQVAIRELASEDPTASRNLLAWLDAMQFRQPNGYGANYLPGDENQAIAQLSKLMRALADKSEVFREHLRWLGRLDNRERDARIANLTDDRITQWAERATQNLDRQLSNLASGLRSLRNQAGWLHR